MIGIFSEIVNSDCPNYAYDKFMSIFKNIFNEIFPVLKTRFNKKYVKREPWISTGLLAYARHKAKLFKKKLSKPTDEDIECYKIYTWSVLKQAIGKQNDNLTGPRLSK